MNINSVVNVAELVILVVMLVPSIVCSVKATIAAVKAKDWTSVMKIALDYMTQAEKLFSSGAERKAWVKEQLTNNAKTFGIMAMTDEQMDQLIDNAVSMAKEVNVSSSANTKEAEEVNG